MKILHVTLGNPVKKQGGMSRYCFEIMKYQKMEEHQVYLLYPGTFINSKKPHIIRRNSYTFEIYDALPVAITYGVSEPEKYMVAVYEENYRIWLEKINPNIIHIHSIQGIHREFFQAAKKLSIPMIFTTHDYYPICLRCVLIDSECKLCHFVSSERCARCNFGAGLSAKRQRMLQSNFYQLVKNFKLIKKFKSRTLNIHFKEKNKSSEELISSGLHLKTDQLVKYYENIMSLISIIHCNSSVSAEQYQLRFPELRQIILPITHDGLTKLDHTRKDKDVLNVSYMGGMSWHKGYQIVMEAFENLEKFHSKGWKLWLYGGEFDKKKIDDRYQYKGFFNKEEEKNVWDNTDLLVVASQCMETFGFIVLEALCRGIPVLCSDLVGSKDFVFKVSRELVFQHDSPLLLAKKIEAFLDDEYYDRIQKKVNRIELSMDMRLHTRDILNLYQKIIEGKENDTTYK